MLFVRRYKDCRTELDSFFEDIIDELQREKELKVASKLYGRVDEERIFKSVTAVKACVPKKLTGTLREITITVTGTPADFFLEIHIGNWSESSISKKIYEKRNTDRIPQVNRVGYTPILDYDNDLIRRINELIRKNSREKLTSKKVESVYA